MTPTQVRLEHEQRSEAFKFSPMDKRIRAELEARLGEEADERLTQRKAPARQFNFRGLLIRLPRLSFLKLQRNLKWCIA
jgi:hypothetical protein